MRWLPTFFGIEIGVIMASRKSSIKKKVVHFGIPSSRRMMKTIKRFIKDTNKVLKNKNKSRVILEISKRLFHEYLFLQISMQEGGFDIHLMDLPFI
jgi:hypothetical protein